MRLNANLVLLSVCVSLLFVTSSCESACAGSSDCPTNAANECNSKEQNVGAGPCDCLHSAGKQNQLEGLCNDCYSNNILNMINCLAGAKAQAAYNLFCFTADPSEPSCQVRTSATNCYLLDNACQKKGCA